MGRFLFCHVAHQPTRGIRERFWLVSWPFLTPLLTDACIPLQPLTLPACTTRQILQQEGDEAYGKMHNPRGSYKPQAWPENGSCYYPRPFNAKQAQLQTV